MYEIETKRYRTRLVREEDFEAVKALIKKNKYIGKLWNVEALSEECKADIVRSVYMNKDSYCVVDKETGAFCGFVSMTFEDDEGEFSVRMEENVSLDDVMEIFGEMLKKVAPSDRETNLTVQYCFE